MTLGGHVVYRATQANCGERQCLSVYQGGPSYFTEPSCTGTEYSWLFRSSKDGHGNVGIVVKTVSPIWSIQFTNGSCDTWSNGGGSLGEASRVYRSNATILSAHISGRSSVRPTQTCTWTASASGGKPPYQFYYWSGANGSDRYQSAFSAQLSVPTTLRVVVTDYDGHTAEATFNVTVSSAASLCPQ